VGHFASWEGPNWDTGHRYVGNMGWLAALLFNSLHCVLCMHTRTMTEVVIVTCNLLILTLNLIMVNFMLC